MRLETLTVEDFNRYLQKSDFHPTEAYEAKLRKRAFDKLMASTVNAAVKKLIEQFDLKLDIATGDAQVFAPNDSPMDMNDVTKEYHDEFHDIDLSKVSQVTSRTDRDVDRAA